MRIGQSDRARELNEANERYYDASPLPGISHHHEHDNSRMFISITDSELQKICPPGLVVEQWHDVAGPSKSGRKRRKFENTFPTPSERKKAGAWYRKMYHWYLRTGVPRQITISPKSLQFLHRLAIFFSSL